jgi:very-short-patch-repair endonuclease
MPICETCKSECKKKFCNKTCYFNRPKGLRKHSIETKQKIAKSNSNPFSWERKKAISVARTYVPTQELLQKLKSYWRLRYINPCIIAELCGLKNKGSVYRRLVREHCDIEQFSFMPKNWYPEHYQKLIELGKQNVYVRDIANCIGFGIKQCLGIATKLGLKLNTRNPNAWTCVTSKPEKMILDELINHGYTVTTQFQLGKFLFDAHVIETNILIEVNGDYWHCNPKVYKNGAINEMQKSHQRRDFAKKAFAAKMGYYLITIWELDINQRKIEIVEWLLKKVKLHGKRINA